jgi:hypothetical protein
MDSVMVVGGGVNVQLVHAPVGQMNVSPTGVAVGVGVGLAVGVGLTVGVAVGRGVGVGGGVGVPLGVGVDGGRVIVGAGLLDPPLHALTNDASATAVRVRTAKEE